MICLTTNIPELEIFRRGKVRDVYALEDRLLIVATDRISAFDVVLPNGIPYKGIVLNQITKFWFDKLRALIENHLISTKVQDFPVTLQKYKDVLAGRSMLVKRTQAFPVECVVRGYLSGSGWKEYVATGAVCGISLPPGLRESDKLAEPIFTPATKAETGHDINISLEEMAKIVGQGRANQLRDISLTLYKQASAYAEERGIIIADTKFEFGEREGQIILIDEALTPDSSRFWPKALYQPGRPQPSFDKQFVRDYLESIKWNKQPPAPELPERVGSVTSQKYLEAYRLLTGQELRST